MAVAGTTGTAVVVIHDAPASPQNNTRTRRIIPLKAFANRGIILADFDKIIIGL